MKLCLRALLHSRSCPALRRVPRSAELPRLKRGPPRTRPAPAPDPSRARCHPTWERPWLGLKSLSPGRPPRQESYGIL